MITFLKDSEEDEVRLAELREISFGSIWIMTCRLAQHSHSTKKKEKRNKVNPPFPLLRVNGHMDLFFFPPLCSPIYLILIGITLLPLYSSGEEGRPSET